MDRTIKLNILLGLIFLLLVAVLFVDPIAQDPAYHQFVDQRSFWGIPNTWNVLSNLPFILVGLFGLISLRRIDLSAMAPIYPRIARIFFIGLALTGLGSGYYHLSPDNETLVWDRLPMTIAFMGFFCFVLAMHIGEGLGRRLLWPLIAVGASSVAYWAYSESIGAGDLRFYAIIQFLPMLLIPTLMLMFPTPSYRARYIWWVIIFYAAAKLSEHFDAGIYDLLGLSGHSLKHIIAAFSGIAFLAALKSIRPKFA